MTVPRPRLMDVVSSIDRGRGNSPRPGKSAGTTGGPNNSLTDGSRFARAVESIRAASLRPEIVIEEVPAPARLAPQALALTGEVTPSRQSEEEPAATGRFVLLYDPSAPHPWDGVWRVVTYAKATVEPELGQDPMLGQVGWSWLTDALDEQGLSYTAEAGAVTCVLSESFGTMADREQQVEMEIRASWSPQDDGIGNHLKAWGDLLCTIAGLPPLPEGVVALPGPRR